ncbi:hypothetical protein TorRG33x02_133640, partial [Trema orientale]
TQELALWHQVAGAVVPGPMCTDEDIKTVKNRGPIQVPVGPVMRARAKRFKEELNSLVRRVLQ